MIRDWAPNMKANHMYFMNKNCRKNCERHFWSREKLLIYEAYYILIHYNVILRVSRDKKHYHTDTFFTLWIRGNNSYSFLQYRVFKTMSRVSLKLRMCECISLFLRYLLRRRLSHFVHIAIIIKTLIWLRRIDISNWFPGHHAYKINRTIKFFPIAPFA